MSLVTDLSPALDGASETIGDGAVRKRSIEIPAGEYATPFWLRLDGSDDKLIHVTSLPWVGTLEAGSMEVLSAEPSEAASTSLSDVEIPTSDDFTAQGTALTPDAGAWDARFPHGTPGPILEKDGTYYLYYIGADGDRSSDGGPAHRAVGVATASSLAGPWSKSGANPVIPWSELQNNNDEEEGAWRVAGLVDDDGTILLYVSDLVGSGGGVNGDIRLFTSTDGTSFTDQGIVVAWDGALPGDDELGPLGAWKGDDGAYYVFYTRGADGSGWTLAVASGPARDDFTAGENVLSSDQFGHGTDPILKSDTDLFMFWGDNNGTFWAFTAPRSDPTSISAKQETYTGLSSDQFAVYLDRANSQWVGFFTTGTQGDSTGVDLYTAPAESTSGSGEHPNEPAGMTTIFEADGSTHPPGENAADKTVGAITGTHFVFEDGRSDAMTVQSVSTAPETPSGVLDFLYPEGLIAGSGTPAIWQVWDANADAAVNPGSQYAEVYEHGWVRTPASDFEFSGIVAGIKFLGYYGVGDGDAALPTQFIVGSPNPDGSCEETVCFRNDWPLEFTMQDHTVGQWHSNLDQSDYWTAGEWHEYELILRVNDPGEANGEIHLWWNGVKVAEHFDVVFRTSGDERGFWGRRFDLVYGGGDLTTQKTRDDHVQFDHVYISGTPL